MEQEGNQRLLKIEDLAELLGLSQPTIRRLAHAGKIPPGVKLGRSRRWRQSDLNAAIIDLTGGGEKKR